MDITFKTDGGRFNYRVCAVILHGEKILAMKEPRTPYYYLPGGRVNLHEQAEQAVLREVKEELNVDAKIIRPLWLTQSFFTEDRSKERFHEICLYFLVDISHTDVLSKGEKFTVNENGRPNCFEWLDFSILQDEYFYPTFIKSHIQNIPDTLEIITENE